MTTKHDACPMNISDFMKIHNKTVSKIRQNKKISIQDQKAEKAYACAIEFQRLWTKNKISSEPFSSSFEKSSNSTDRGENQKENYLEPEEKETETLADPQGLHSSERNQKGRKHNLGSTKCKRILSRTGTSEILIPTQKEDSTVKIIENALHFFNFQNTDPMIKTINYLRLETPICTLPDIMVKTEHIDDVCGFGKIDTTNKWTISLLPNRQVRLEDENHCYCLRLARPPIFEDETAIVEGPLVPGGHLFRLTFVLGVNDEDKDKWLTLNDKRWACNESMSDYLIRHPYGSLESIRLGLRIAFVHDPEEVDSAFDVMEMFDCYYCQRHFIYEATTRQFSGRMIIKKWGARDDLNALFFMPEGCTEDSTDYLMAIIYDMVWFRAWKATLYADFEDSDGTAFMEIVKKDSSQSHHTITPLKTDFLAIRGLHGRDEKNFVLGKFVFDFASHQFSTINLLNREECFEVHRIIAKPATDEEDYDFKVTGRNVRTKAVIELRVRVVIAENRHDWEKAVAIPLPRAYAFLEILLRELSEKGSTLCDIKISEKENSKARRKESSDTFQELSKVIADFAKVEILSTFFFNCSPLRLEKLALLTFDILYHPLISLDEAKEIINNDATTVDVFDKDRVRIMQLLHQHIRSSNLDKGGTNKPPNSSLPIWRQLVPHFMRLDELIVDNRNNLIEAVAKYLEKAPFGCPNKPFKQR